METGEGVVLVMVGMGTGLYGWFWFDVFLSDVKSGAESGIHGSW